MVWQNFIVGHRHANLSEKITCFAKNAYKQKCFDFQQKQKLENPQCHLSVRDQLIVNIDLIFD